MSEETDVESGDDEIEFIPYEPQVVGLGNEELVILDVLAFADITNSIAVSYVGGTTFVLDRDTQEWRVIAPYTEKKKPKTNSNLSSVKPISPSKD